jgi:hypothetical protein
MNSWAAFIGVSVMFVRQVHRWGGTPENVRTTSLLYLYCII